MSKQKFIGDAIAKRAKEQGFRVRRTKSGWWIYGKDGVATVGFHRSPDMRNRGFQNLLSDLKKIGVQL